jgi:hypothetical protein
LPVVFDTEETTGRPTWSAGAPELTGDAEIPREGSVY